MTAREDSVYIGIENPVEIRRALLESSKSLIKVLQAGERLKANKLRKQRLISDLKETMKEVVQLLAQLKSEMPKIKMSSLPKKRQPKPLVDIPESEISVRKMPAPKPRPVRMTEAQKLEKELQDIEKKLGEL